MVRAVLGTPHALAPRARRSAEPLRAGEVRLRDLVRDEPRGGGARRARTTSRQRRRFLAQLARIRRLAARARARSRRASARAAAPARRTASSPRGAHGSRCVSSPRSGSSGSTAGRSSASPATSTARTSACSALRRQLRATEERAGKPVAELLRLDGRAPERARLGGARRKTQRARRCSAPVASSRRRARSWSPSARRSARARRDDPRHRARDRAARRARSSARSRAIRAADRRARRRQAGADPGEPPPRRVDRQALHEPRPPVPRPDPGGEHRPHARGRQVRVPARLQVLDLRHVVDPAGDHARDRRPGAHHPHPGAHGRDDQQADPHLALPGAGDGPRADAGGDRRSAWRCRSRRCAGC